MHIYFIISYQQSDFNLHSTITDLQIKTIFESRTLDVYSSEETARVVHLTPSPPRKCPKMHPTYYRNILNIPYHHSTNNIISN